MVDKLKTLPLETQPGTAWDYGPSVNIQGYIVEKLSGQSLDVYFDEHIFKPLGMIGHRLLGGSGRKPAAWSRVHTYDATARSRARSRTGPTTVEALASSPARAGSMSTAEDYWRFCAGGAATAAQLDGKRILKAKTRSS